MREIAALTGVGVEEAPILVVDDERVSRNILEALLRRAGYRNVIGADCGEAALAVLETVTPACILLDVIMPGIDGLELCRRLRGDPRYARTPIIVQTALSDPADRRAAFAAGASDIVTKPFDVQELSARVRVHVASCRFADGLLAYQRTMEAELGEARVLVETVLPDAETLEAIAGLGVVLSHFHRPCSAIGGDYWRAWPTTGGQVAMVVGDVSGHGVAAALRLFTLHTLVTPPPPVVAPLAMAERLDRRLYAHGAKQAHYVAGTYGLLDAAGGVLRYVGAGLRPALVLRADGSIEIASLSGLPFGLLPDTPRDVRELRLAAGDTLILYSDALVESGDPHGHCPPRNEDDLRAWLAGQLAARTPDGPLAPWIGEAFMDRFGDGVCDDLLIVAARIVPVGPATRAA